MSDGATEMLREEGRKVGHYNQGAVSCIEAIRAALTDEEFRGFCKGNALKYIWRERQKDGEGSMSKAEDYLRWAKLANHNGAGATVRGGGQFARRINDSGSE